MNGEGLSLTCATHRKDRAVLTPQSGGCLQLRTFYLDSDMAHINITLEDEDRLRVFLNERHAKRNHA